VCLANSSAVLAVFPNHVAKGFDAPATSSEHQQPSGDGASEEGAAAEEAGLWVSVSVDASRPRAPE
jgi:hypothetical protein